MTTPCLVSLVIIITLQVLLFNVIFFVNELIPHPTFASGESSKMTTVYFTILLLTIVTTIANGSYLPENKKSFDGYQVFRVKIETEVQLKSLQKLEDVADFWNEPEVGRTADIMVSPFDLQAVTQIIAKDFDWTVLIPDVGKIIDEEQKQQNRALEENTGTDASLMFWTQYQRLGGIYNWMESLKARYPSLVSTRTIGFSHEGRLMRLIQVSRVNDSSRPAVFFDSGIHAREWISPSTLTYIIDQLITNPEYADILDAIDIHALPVVNPDGYEYTHTTQRLWRKSRKPNGNCIGTDLNRNFPFQWCTVGASNNSCAETYCGPGPGSEPETRVVMDYLAQTNINWWGFVTLHSYGQEWCIPWAYTAEHAPDYDEMWAVGQIAVDALEATHGTKFTLKIPSGRYGGFSLDWAKGVRGIKYPVLIELRDTGSYGFLLPAAQIIPSGEETLAAIVAYLREIIRQAAAASSL